MPQKSIKMTFIKSWEEFEKAAERLYLQEPSKVRYVMKYTHSNSQLVLKMTDDRVVDIFLFNILSSVFVTFKLL